MSVAFDINDKDLSEQLRRLKIENKHKMQEI